MEKELVKKKAEVKHSKKQFIESKKFGLQADLLNALLDDGLYTVAEVENKINQFKGVK